MIQLRAHASHLRRLIPGSLQTHESMVHAALQLLALRGVPAVPIHTGPRVTPRTGGGFDLRANRMQVGFFDIAGCLPWNGRALMIEAKTGRARRKPAQVRMHEHFSAAGALCVLMRSVLDLETEIPWPTGWTGRSRP